MARIQPHILDILKQSKVDGDLLILPHNLHRKNYLSVNKVIEALGGKWNRKHKGHVFPSNPSNMIRTVCETGTYIDGKQEFQAFDTPSSFADKLIELAKIKAGEEVLEPSAGTGEIAQKLQDAGANVHCIELQEDLAHKLASRFPFVNHGDFLEVKPSSMYDAVVMNPPFTRNQDVDHVLHAWKFLKPGGRLVAVMSAGITFRNDRKPREFREWVIAQNGTINENPEGLFRTSGTMVKTVTVVVQKDT